MLFSILIYDDNDAVNALPQAEDDRLVAGHRAVQEKLTAEGRLGPCVRLGGSETAKTYRPGSRSPVMDGPYAETKEQLLGLYVVDCPTIEAAMAVARSLPELKSIFEVRPVRLFFPGVGLPAQADEG